MDNTQVLNQENVQTPTSSGSVVRFKLKDDQFGVSGVVNECLPNTMFRVQIEASDVPELVGRELLFTLAGKMRLHRIRVMPGDKVEGYVTKYDMVRGKIMFRTK